MIRSSHEPQLRAYDQIAEGLQEAIAVVKGEAEPYRTHNIEPQPLAAQTEPDGGSDTVAAELAPVVGAFGPPHIAAEGDAVETSAPIPEPGDMPVGLAEPAATGDDQPANIKSAQNTPETANEQPEAHGSSPCDGAREAYRPATYGQLVTAGETAPHSHVADELPVATTEHHPAEVVASNSNVTPLRSASGLERMPGCQNVDACAGKWNARCSICERDWNAASHGSAVA